MVGATKVRNATIKLGENMNVKSIAKAYNSVKKFNKISGVLENPSLATIDLYNSLGFEELCESIEAFETEDAVEVLDGAVDELYVIFGKLQVLEALGMNVEEAIKRVCENNLSKFTPTEKLLRHNVDLVVSINKEYEVSVLKDVNGKIKKPEGFQPVILTDLVPQDFFK